jgi:hypothetical protein
MRLDAHRDSFTSPSAFPSARGHIKTNLTLFTSIQAAFVGNSVGNDFQSKRNGTNFSS